MDLSDGKVARLAISVGGLTTHPYRATVAEKMLKGKLLTEPVKAAAVATFAVVLKAFLLDILIFFISRFSRIFPSL
jgi:xanthine dehydrogenase iron-sulfur cluster and FAD-binding subunit A